MYKFRNRWKEYNFRRFNPGFLTSLAIAITKPLSCIDFTGFRRAYKSYQHGMVVLDISDKYQSFAVTSL